MVAQHELHGLTAPIRIARIAAFVGLAAFVAWLMFLPILLWPIGLWAASVVVFVKVQGWMRDVRREQPIERSAHFIGRATLDVVLGIVTFTSLSVLASAVAAANWPGLSDEESSELGEAARTLRLRSRVTLGVSALYPLLIVGTYVWIAQDPLHLTGDDGFGYFFFAFMAIFGGLGAVIGVNSIISLISLKQIRSIIERQSAPVA